MVHAHGASNPPKLGPLADRGDVLHDSQIEKNRAGVFSPADGNVVNIGRRARLMREFPPRAAPSKLRPGNSTASGPAPNRAIAPSTVPRGHR